MDASDFVLLYIQYLTNTEPLSVTDLSSTADDGLKVRISFKVGYIHSGCKFIMQTTRSISLAAKDLVHCPYLVEHIVQGCPGSYTEDAAFKAYPKCETVPCNEFEDAFKV